MSKARQLADLGGDTANLEDISSVLSSGPLSNRNLIINGAMQVAQRGTSVPVGAGTYTLDRWSTDRDGTVTATVSQQSFTLGQTDVPREPQNYLRFDVTAASGGSYLGLRHFIENVRTGAGQTVTLSFWAKADASRTLNMRYHQYCGSGGTSISPVSLTAKSLTTSWQKFTETFTLPSLSGKTVSGGNDSLRILFDLPANTVMQLDITQVQLEVGDTATPFEHRSYGQELALCQRYCQVIGGDSIYNQIAFGFAFSSTRCDVKYIAPTTFRAIPSLTTVGQWDVTDGTTGSDVSSLTIAGSQSSRYLIEMQASVTGMTTNRFVRVESEASTAVKAIFDAEL